MDSSRRVESWTFETIQKFVDRATKEQVAALQETFKRQADLMRRHEKDESAAFWEALAIGVADAVARSCPPDPGATPKRDAA
jgi:murein L,D-transpeptidase YafK